jgi:DNA integrity scanning protein DisA with diadenylate cyclase activity
MKLKRNILGNDYERLAINIAELINDLDCEQEKLLRDLLTKAYHEA